MGSFDLTSSDYILIGLLCGFAVVILVLNCIPGVRVVLLPLKLIVIALHEFGHASAGVATCAKIEGIEVNPDEGGVTRMRGGISWITLPAGYLGSNLWGALMIFLSPNEIAVQIVSGFLCAALIAVLFWADNWLPRFLVLIFLAAMAGFWALQILTSFMGLTYAVLFMGVFSCLYSIMDIYDDLVRRKVNESDASLFAKECPCCPSQGWGVIWALFSIAVMIGACVGAVYVW
ncbi:hypothetical protein FVE85_7371 [Porphyridium purpureum]|uniref:Peptidase M50B-like protein n=1 Tax=Porphyridium purpureum TaxID=35688 RepID=A0A5J4Z7S3_PORPP|nr:hypothetical protein FVE85_7371 [Porphyridium purpureum]|eukprot:POR7584..scf295_1